MGRLPDADEVFSAIAAPTRRALLRMVAQGETPVNELAEQFDMSVSAVSQHLSVLKDAGLVSLRKDGRQRLYRLNPEPLRAVADWLEFYEPFWTDRLHRLGRYLDESTSPETSNEEKS